MAEKEKIKIDMHAARSSGGRVIWAEIATHARVVRNAEELHRHFGDGASLSWTIVSNGIGTQLSTDDPRVEQDGFLLRIPERDARTGMRAVCTLNA